jgi:hypothetical protein
MAMAQSSGCPSTTATGGLEHHRPDRENPHDCALVDDSIGDCVGRGSVVVDCAVVLGVGRSNEPPLDPTGITLDPQDSFIDELKAPAPQSLVRASGRGREDGLSGYVAPR